MLKKYFGAFLLLLSFPVCAQSSLLGTLQPGKKHSITDTLGEFYLIDEIQIHRFFQQIDTTVELKSNLCPADYVVYYRKSGSQKPEKITLRLTCNTLDWNGKTYRFSSENLHYLMDVARTPELQVMDFPAIKPAREAYAHVMANPDLLYVAEPEWVRYEGSADYQFECAGTDFDCVEMRRKIRDFLLGKIDARFPDELVDIQIAGGDAEKVRFEIHCSENLGKELPYILSDSSLKWKAYSRFYLKIWWKRP